MAQAERRDPEGDLIEIIAGFQHDPLGFVLYAFPWGEPGTELANETGPRPWQIETLTIIAEALSSGDLEGALRIATASGHGIGKSALVSWVSGDSELDHFRLLAVGIGDAPAGAIVCRTS